MNRQGSDEEGMLIGELARKTNVSVRTIRFYISEGLLPAPQARGRFASYDEDALLRLQVIRLLKEAFLPLREIRERLSGLNTDEVRSLLNDLEQLPAAPKAARSTAVDYIDQITTRTEVPHRDLAEHNKMYNAPPPRMPVPRGPLMSTKAESWRHYRITPGITIQASDGLDRVNEKKLEELLKFASQLFSDQGVRNV